MHKNLPLQLYLIIVIISIKKIKFKLEEMCSKCPFSLKGLVRTVFNKERKIYYGKNYRY